MAHQQCDNQQMQPDQENRQEDHKEDVVLFVCTGRTGRRNAVPDALIDPNRSLATSGLSDMFMKIGCTDRDAVDPK